ncbi:hypothetical protein [Pararhodobacter sp.]|uniref:hypothetical protein n=1 Tax=Pararhodobacter sp. TaxID=2127056 RepID=UPI002FDCB2FF
MRRALHGVVTAVCMGGTALGTGAVLQQSPFTAPFVERSTHDVQRALERATARTVTPEWLLPRLTEALAEEDRDRVTMLTALAQDHAITLPAPLPEQIAAFEAAQEGWLRGATDCALCAYDIMSCPSITLIGACAVPVELTPLGDINALRRAAVAALSGEEPDQLEVGLAVVGLGATGLVVVSGGSTVTLKAGATMLRLARRLGTLTPGLMRSLRSASDIPVVWSRMPDFALGRAPLSAVTDTARLSDLGRMTQNVGTLGRNTSTADALVLLRHVDSAEDAARMARLSTAAGPGTRRTVEVLGKTRAFRALVRLSNAAIAALALIYALALQLLLLAGSWAGSRLLRMLTRPRAGHSRAPVS